MGYHLDHPIPQEVTCNLLGAHMSDAEERKAVREKVRRYRERMRRQGLRPVQIWVPDVRAPGFRDKAHRQSLAVANSSYAEDDQDFVDSVSQLDEE